MTLFVACLVATLGLLAGAVATGLRARRRAHLALVASAVVGLGTTIAVALKVGTLYDLEAAGRITTVHLTLARVATGAFLLPAATGALTLRNPRMRRVHRWCAFFAISLACVAVVTGAWMLIAAPRIA